MLLVSNFNLNRNTNGESHSNLINETTDTTESEVEIKKKRGQPRQNREGGNKEWEDDKIFALIDTWSGIKQHFNCKHPKSHLRDEKMKSLEKIIVFFMKTESRLQGIKEQIKSLH